MNNIFDIFVKNDWDPKATLLHRVKSGKSFLTPQTTCKYLHGNRSYPKMIDYNDDQNGTSRKIHLVKFETARCYEFKRADFTATEISSLQGELPLIMPQVQNEVVSSTEQITIDEF